jgi:Poxvirus Late Transcription Factor VLTF3 like
LNQIEIILWINQNRGGKREKEREMVLRFKSSTKGNHKHDQGDGSNISIEAYHKEKIAYFKALQNSLPEKRKSLKNMIKQYKEIKVVANEDKFNMDLMVKKSQMRDEIEELQRTIQSIENKEEEHEYFMKADNVLNVYFDNLESSKVEDDNDFFGESSNSVGGDGTGESGEVSGLAKFIVKRSSKATDPPLTDSFVSPDSDPNPVSTSPSISGQNPTIFSLDPFRLNLSLPSSEDFGPTPSTLSSATTALNENLFKTPSSTFASINKPIVYSSKKITDFVEKECKINKKELLDEYLRSVDKNYTPKMKIDTSIYKCPCCDVEMILYSSDGVQICQKCGLEQNVIIESEKPSFKDPPIEAVFFSYKPINHFNEILAQFQAKESTEIPEDVYNTILQEIKKERITNLATLTTDKIKKYLKKNGLTKYTDHIAYILYKINGVPPPQLSKDLEEKLRLMFKEIQGPFMEVCPNDRKNLLNYSYVLHKFFELLELDDFKKYFPLLKDREKLYKTEMVWKKICEKLGWKFIKSI